MKMNININKKMFYEIFDKTFDFYLKDIEDFYLNEIKINIPKDLYNHIILNYYNKDYLTNLPISTKIENDNLLIFIANNNLKL